MADIINFPDKTDAYDRSCGECGSSLFTWQTYSSQEELHALECAECGEVYPISGVSDED